MEKCYMERVKEQICKEAFKYEKSSVAFNGLV